ncbi:PREDICTED: laminin subunit gamma-1-like [Priapulus caudatus]|uniref:Laminin subunit gamma-1-like n=1 Tax=Priapulus caudatus TaxID=37621 RepID=A0ABM1EEE9_PRICU|nr:PREDICTED: laminin subunit gamma-1-like [Priapulus caudatus]
MCEHKTTGPDCERCLPFYNDQPWGRATVSDARQCQPCDCNGLSVTCYFDPDLHARTGHGGHCTDCRENTSGPHCELCRENFYRRPVDDRCSDCQCNPTGSRTLQCDDGGRCQCKPGVTGDKCDRCQPGFYEFGEGGCRSCDCTEAGSLDNSPTCDSRNGQCSCKEHVEGRTCDQCKPGYFNLESDNKFGCIPCFCYGHSSTCQSSDDYVARNIGADFNNGAQNWKAVDQEGNRVDIQWNAITQNIGVNAEKNEMVYFTAPSRFLGDRRASYNQILEFSLHIGEEGGSPTRYDVVLVGGDGQKVSVPVFAQRQQMPRTVGQKFKFKLSEHPDYQWSPYMNPISFMHLLSNLTELKIRGTYTPGGVGFLDAIKLGSARRGSSGDPARWVEQCTCTDSYLGQNCEDCAPGFRRDPPNGGPLDRCVPCQCNNHSETCDVQTGRCICQHYTEGNNCERCVSGYYGNPSMGTPNDCQVCPCPNQGPCIQVQDNQVACLNCPAGYGGLLCDVCTDGHYGDPEGKYGLPSDCMSCTCNDNIDPNAIGNCNGTTGECLKCIYDTTGRMCERCLPGFYGSALTNDKPGCHACNCYPPGTDANGDGEVQCDMDNGQCPCKENVSGRKCGECAVGYWNIDRYYDAEDLFDRTKQLAEDAREQATEVYDEVLETLTDANSLQLPTVDSDAYNTQATQISEEAERISDEAMSLMTDNEQLIEDISGQEEEARRLLREGERQQNIADEMLADVDRAKAKAEEAVAKGDETLTEARETLKTLQDFDKQVRESEGKAKEAMTQVPDIEQLIGDAENKTQAAQNLLADAEHDATEARDIARQAQTIAEGASDDAGNIREEAGTTKQRAGELKDESTTLADEVSTLDDLLTQLENQTGTNELLAKQALSKADQAKKKATASSIKVQTALDTVKQILDTLNNLDSVDEVRLNELERDLEEAEKRLKDANLEERVQELRVANEQQSQWVKDYSADLEQLRRDVDNIEDIRDALPDGCFRTEVLEPVG